MLGRTASGLYWMFRQLERSENTARLLEAGMRMALTRAASSENEWASIVMTAGNQAGYQARHDGYDADRVADFPALEGPSGQRFPADLEFAFRDGRLALLQLRPFVRSRRAEESERLRALDAPLRERADRIVRLDEGPGGDGT